MRSSSTSARGFSIGLYQEHLEEASFLYEQRLALVDDPESRWMDLAGFEERFETHIDALVVGEDLALGVCKNRSLEGDFGELHAAIRVFCRRRRMDLLLEVLGEIDPEDAEKLLAASDAMNDELPESWTESLLSVLSGKQGLIAARLAQLFHRKDAKDAKKTPEIASEPHSAQ